MDGGDQEGVLRHCRGKEKVTIEEATGKSGGWGSPEGESWRRRSSPHQRGGGSLVVNPGRSVTGERGDLTSAHFEGGAVQKGACRVGRWRPLNTG
jgi:hypothetical protein